MYNVCTKQLQVDRQQPEEPRQQPQLTEQPPIAQVPFLDHADRQHPEEPRQQPQVPEQPPIRQVAVLDHSVPHVECFPSELLDEGDVKADKSTQTQFKSDGTATQVLTSFAQIKDFKRECD